MKLDVAICTDREDAPLATTLAAVVAQFPAPLVVIAGIQGDGAARAATAARAAAPAARVVHEPGPGLAHARNRALALCDGDVLCLLDDDALPAAMWLAALRAAWAAGGDTLAAAGGPVRALFTDPPPWLAPDQLSALGSVDHGDEERDLDPAVHTLMGANLSLRVCALAGVGGFWPARGHQGARDWFGEEHHAQRELGALGWRMRWVPAAAASRRIDGRHLTRRSVLARRLRYGARLGTLSDERPTGEALRHALSSSVGAPAAIAWGRQPLALSRAARAAENVGVVLGERLAGADFEPTGPTPFRASGPPARRFRRRPRAAPGALVLLYHRVADVLDDPQGLSVTPGHFAEQLEVLRRLPVCDVGELAAQVRSGESPPPGAVAITFDDGYHDNLVNAAPALERAGLPATVFVSTHHVATQTPFFWDELERAFLGPGRRPDSLTLTIDDDVRAWRTVTAPARARARRHAHEWLQPRPPEEIEAALAQLRAWSGQPVGAGVLRPLTVDELRELARRPGIVIGAHSRRHVNLAHRPALEQAEEIAGSRDDVWGWLSARPRGFSYPFGVPGTDFTPATEAIVRREKFAYAVANAPGLVGPGSDPFALPRVVAPDLGGEAFAAWLDGVAGSGAALEPAQHEAPVGA